jgi:hypothetical protein
VAAHPIDEAHARHRPRSPERALQDERVLDQSANVRRAAAAPMAAVASATMGRVRFAPITGSADGPLALRIWARNRHAANNYSITSSAMASSPGGTAMPSVRAVCRLMQSESAYCGHRLRASWAVESVLAPACSWDNSPRPGAGEKLFLLPAKVIELVHVRPWTSSTFHAFRRCLADSIPPRFPACPHLVATAAPAA